MHPALFSLGERVVMKIMWSMLWFVEVLLNTGLAWRWHSKVPVIQTDRWTPSSWK